ncbi:hypothetical protein HKBW3C_00787, partial [Candidatus Hakubella thermalkaliphila]
DRCHGVTAISSSFIKFSQMVLITFKIQGAGLQAFDLQGEVMGRILEAQKIWVNSKFSWI